MLSVQRYDGALVNNEPGVIVTPRDWQKGRPIPGIIFCHGYGDDATDPWGVGVDEENGGNLFRYLVEKLETPVLTSYFGGNTWGNDATLSKIDAAKSYLQNTIGTQAGKIILIGRSMGHVAALRYAEDHKSEVVCVISISGVTDLADLASQSSGYSSSLSASYPSGYANQSPLYNTNARFGDIPWQGWHGTSDTTIAKLSKMQQFVTAYGPKATLNQISGAHGWATAANIDKAKVESFIRKYAVL